ncbi:MAG: hypothetical protein LAP40_17725 [Acidobacteriia bacterium]|nr:hypothetical protein [Terriglobia bacterium]
MSEDRDNRLVELLRADAPPERDPVFRLKVLERREQRQFQRRLLTMLAGMLVILVGMGFAISLGNGALAPTGALIVGAALVSGYLAFRGQVRRILGRFSL